MKIIQLLMSCNNDVSSASIIFKIYAMALNKGCN